MSYHVAYVTHREGPPVDGDILGSGRGWLRTTDWILERHEDCPCAAHLAEEGWIEPGEAMVALEGELEALLEQGPPENVAGVLKGLLEAVKGRPEKCLGIIVTDGTPGVE